MEKMPITKAGFEKLKKELDQLKRVLIPENIKAIEEARGHGDISENAEYQYAKERQSFLHGRQQEIENCLATSQIVELNGLTGDRVVFGTTVSFADIDTGDETRYQLVGPYESDVSNNRSPSRPPSARPSSGRTWATSSASRRRAVSVKSRSWTSPSKNRRTHSEILPHDAKREGIP